MSKPTGFATSVENEVIIKMNAIQHTAIIRQDISAEEHQVDQLITFFADSAHTLTTTWRKIVVSEIGQETISTTTVDGNELGPIPDLNTTTKGEMKRGQNQTTTTKRCPL